MSKKRIFITGASGCVGHYLVETLIRNTDHELFLLIRDPERLKVDRSLRAGVHLIPGSLESIAPHRRLLATMDVAILVATAWGDPAITQQVNVDSTLEILDALDPQRLERVYYFSTESVLGYDNKPLPEAELYGTDYIRTKAECLKALEQHPLADRITVLFPTLVFGGEPGRPYSHLSSGLREVVGWLWLIRFFQADASFHFVHSYDIAQIVRYLIDHPPEQPGLSKLVLGSPAMTVNEAIAQTCRYFGVRRSWLRLPLSHRFAELMLRLFRIEVQPWDRHCIRYRHFTHQGTVSPADFGMVPYANTLAQLFEVSGLPPRA